MKFVVVFALSLSLGVKEVCSLDCYFCYGPSAICSSATANRSCLPHEINGPNSTAACYHAYRTDMDLHAKGCQSREECLRFSKECQEGTNGIPCVSHCCFDDLCNIGLGDEAQSCEAGLDIGIVIDKSLSVKKGNLQNAIRLLRDVVSKSNPSPEADHFGLITFNSIATLEFDFKDPNFHNKTALLARIDAEPGELKKWTRIDLALEKAKNMFSIEGGDRPGMPNLMVVLTDGKFTNKTEEEFTAIVNMVSGDFQQKNVSIVVVGLGESIRSDVLVKIAGSTGEVKPLSELESVIARKKEELGVCPE